MPGAEPQLLQDSPFLLFLSPHHYQGSTPSPLFCQNSLLPHSISMFPGPGPVCLEFGKPPDLLPASCSLGAGKWCQSLSVTRLWLQKTLVSGVLPISLGLYLLHHLPVFFFFLLQRNPPPLLFSRLIAKARPFAGDHRQRPLYRLREGLKERRQ